MKSKQYSGIKYIPKDDDSQRMKEEIKAAFDRIKKPQQNYNENKNCTDGV